MPAHRVATVACNHHPDNGYSLARPDALVLWEAQFGDFANGAQTVVDEYIASSEQKWGQRSGVTLLLPHGLEGQGPDRSSGRIERFLQLCAQGNMSVAMPSLPGNYFHLLRQQALSEREHTRPLVVFTPKSMLRLNAATSTLTEFTTGMSDSTIVRVERLYPFPEQELSAELARFPALAEVRWVQEEPESQGAWSFVGPHVQRLANRPVGCVSRPPAPTLAVGSARRHAGEQKDLVASAFR